jgi:hypothetical protein
MSTLFDDIRISVEQGIQSALNGLKTLSDTPVAPEVGLGITLQLDGTTGYFWWVWYKNKRVGSFGFEDYRRNDLVYTYYWLRHHGTYTRTDWFESSKDHNEQVSKLFEDLVLRVDEIK